MGICGGSKTTPKQTFVTGFNEEPLDTESLKNISLPTLTFSVMISDVKLKKCSYPFAALKMQIPNIHQYVMPEKELEAGHKAYWRNKHTFQFKMTEYELRKHFLFVQAYDRYKVQVGSFKINLYLVWTGPYHFDFRLPMAKDSTARISFNCKISQEIAIKLESVECRSRSNENQEIGSEHAFSFVAIIGQQADPSQYSYTVTQSETDSTGVVWKSNSQRSMPSFARRVSYYEIYSSSFHLMVWKLLYGVDSDHELRYEMEAECYISITKMLKYDYKVVKDQSTCICNEERIIPIEEKAWLHGKEVGSIIFIVKFTIQTHQKQLQSCVRTENGILASSPVFLGLEGQTGTQCPQIEVLSRLHVQIQNEFLQASTKQDSKAKSMAYKSVSRILQLMREQLNLLKSSKKQSKLFYEYKNEKDLYKAQKVLIDLAFKTACYVHQENLEIETMGWIILTSVLKRGEFSLNYIGFNKEERVAIAGNNVSQNLRTKIEVGLKYQQLLNFLLKEALVSLQFKGDSSQQQFTESFCAYAYFRIPQFRQHILSSIRRGDDPEIPEWRGTEFNLYDENSVERDEAFYDNLFDWSNNFYKCISHDSKYEANQISLSEILREDKWKIRLQKRGGAFYKFVENWVREIQYVCVVSKYVKWQYLPGYTRLLHAFLIQMKTQKIKAYTEMFKRCALKLLSNEKLLNIFIVILLKKTNSNDISTTFTTFQYIDEFLKVVHSQLRPIPGTFDYKFFCEGLKIILESEIQYAISHVLLLIYNHYELFSQDFAAEMSLYLLGRVFFKLFFHWSYNLRKIFQTLLYCRISRFDNVISTIKNVDSSPTKPSMNNMRQALSRRHELLMQMIKEQSNPRTLTRKVLSIKDIAYEKEIYRKMKARLLQKRYKRNRWDVEGGLKRDLPLVTAKSQAVTLTKEKLFIRKLNFVHEGETQVIPIKDNEMLYFSAGVQQYECLKEDIDKHSRGGKVYLPELCAKKILDEKELKPIDNEEW